LSPYGHRAEAVTIEVPDGLQRVVHGRVC
jgi:hypothetical protein